MRVETRHTVTYEPESRSELEQLAEILPPLVHVYDEIEVVYHDGPSSDFIATIEKETMTVSWMNFDTLKKGEERFEKLTSGILELVLSNA